MYNQQSKSTKITIEKEFSKNTFELTNSDISIEQILELLPAILSSLGLHLSSDIREILTDPDYILDELHSYRNIINLLLKYDSSNDPDIGIESLEDAVGAAKSASQIFYREIE